MPHSSSNPEELLEHWNEGVARFNSRRFWDAHESWENGWIALPLLQKLHVQALIQTAGIFHLIEKGRVSAAGRLCRLALEKLRQVAALGGIQGVYPRVEIDGLEGCLNRLSSCSDDELPGEISRIFLKAELLLSPP